MSSEDRDERAERDGGSHLRVTDAAMRAAAILGQRVGRMDWCSSSVSAALQADM